MKKLGLLICLISAVIWILVGCGSDVKSGGVISLQVLNTHNAITASSVGQNTAAGLQHLKYYITGITLYKDLTTDDSAYHGGTGPLSIYRVSGGPDYDSYDAAAARADNDLTHYIDLMDSVSLAKLANQVQLDSSNVGEYNYVVIDWYRPIKVTAEVPVFDGATLYTKDPVSLPISTPLTTSPAEEAVVELNNGGTWFKFQKPLVITEADIDNKVNFKVALTFDPEGIIQGATGFSGDNNFQIRDSSNNNICIPYLDVAAVAHRDSEHVKREKYTIHYNSGGTVFDIRVALYYLAEDSDKIIYGTEVKGLVNENSNAIGLNQINKIFFIRTEEDETLSFLDWQQEAFISRFTRLSTVGQTSISPASVITTMNSSAQDCNYTLDSIDDVNDI